MADAPKLTLTYENGVATYKHADGSPASFEEYKAAQNAGTITDAKTGQAFAPSNANPASDSGNPFQALADTGRSIGSAASSAGAAVKDGLGAIKNKLEGAIYQQNVPSAADSVDGVAIRDFATKLRQQYANLTPEQAQQIAAQQIQAQKLDQSQANGARDVAGRNLEGLEATANGGPTAADSLLRQGTDAAARNATGLAASLSASNPGLALERGLAASNDAYAKSAAVAGQQKANEIAAARGAVGSLADSMRNADLGAATTNANLSADAAARNQTAALQSAKANQDAQLQQQQINNQNQQANAKIATDATGALLPAQINTENNQAHTEAANTGITDAVVGKVGEGLADIAVKKITSDERAKTGIKRKSLADEYADKIHGVSFSYRKGIADGGKHVGVLAQDVEKALPGVVSPDSRGVKSIDVGHLTTANAAALADIAGRLRKLEGKRG